MKEVLWIFDYCSARVIKVNLTKDSEKELNENPIGEDFLSTHEKELGIDLESCSWMFIRGDVEIEEKEI